MAGTNSAAALSGLLFIEVRFLYAYQNWFQNPYWREQGADELIREFFLRTYSAFDLWG